MENNNSADRFAMIDSREGSDLFGMFETSCDELEYMEWLDSQESSEGWFYDIDHEACQFDDSDIPF